MPADIFDPIDPPETRQGLRKLRLVPSWQGNLLVFGLLIGMVLVYFAWQTRQANRTFLVQVQQSSRMLAGVIQLNAQSAVLSENLFQQIMSTFLGNTARFVDYLDTVEPFSDNELAAFANEAGLAGIRIQRPADRIQEGPKGWFPGEPKSCVPNIAQLVHLSAHHLYYLTYPRSEDKGCLIVGIATERIEKLQQQIGLPALFETLSGLGGIRYVRFQEATADMQAPKQSPEIVLFNQPGRQVAEIRRAMDNRVLVIGLEAGHHFERVRGLWRELAVSGSLLALGGIFLSWVLYRMQTAVLENTRIFERKLAHQREDAALGRATAAIAHEVRNPLNAIAMGLQRLQMETGDLESTHRELIVSMQSAVKRTDGIIADLRRFARPLHPRQAKISLHELVEQVVTLYQPLCKAAQVALQFSASGPISIFADAHLIAEAIENIIKNALEAQPEGGYIKVKLHRENHQARLVVENAGFKMTPETAKRILEPYFTTKTRGSGLGLPIAARIVHAHGGDLKVEVTQPGIVCIQIQLPAIA